MQTTEPVRAANLLTDWALDHDIDLGHFSVTQPTLEDIYLELTGSGDQPAGSTDHNPTTEEATV